MLKNRQLLLVLKITIFMCVFENSFSQNPFFSQTYSAPLYFNPAFAGINGAGKLASVFQSTKMGIDNISSYYASYDQFVNKINTGIGGYFLNDKISDFYSSNTFALALSRGISCAKKKIKLIPGLTTAYVQNKLKDVVTQSKSYLDLTAGLEGFSKRFSFGAVARHVNMPNNSFVDSIKLKMPMQFDFAGDYTFGNIDDEKKPKAITVGGRVYSGGGRSLIYQAQVAIVYYKFKVAFAYSDNLISAQMAYVGKIIKLRYSYGFGANDVGANKGVHEGTTSFNLFTKKRKEDFLPMNYFGF